MKYHVIADCMECGKQWTDRNAWGVGVRHANATGHRVLVDVTYTHSYPKEKK